MKLNVTVIPNAKNPEVTKISETEYKIRVDAPASEGRANKRLIEILSEQLKVSKSSISIIKGMKCKNKIVEVDL